MLICAGSFCDKVPHLGILFIEFLEEKVFVFECSFTLNSPYGPQDLLHQQAMNMVRKSLFNADDDAEFSDDDVEEEEGGVRDQEKSDTEYDVEDVED